MRKPRLLAAGMLLAATALVSAACGGVKNPEGWAAPAVDTPEAYLLLKKDRLASVTLADNAPSGQVNWRFPDSNRYPDQKDVDLKAVYTEPVVEGETLYFGDYENGVFALNAGDGSLKWHFNDSVEGKIVGDLGVSEQYLSFGTTDGRVYVINKADGTPVEAWKGGKSFDKGVWAPPVISGDTVFVATMGGELTAYNIADGAERWAQPFEVSGAIAEIELLDQDRLFVPSLNKHVYVVSTADGRELAQFKASDWVWTSAAFKDNVAYFGDFGGMVYAVDITNGATKVWEYDAGAKVKAGPAIVENVPGQGDVLVVADRDAVVHFLNLDTGQALNKVPLPDGSGTVRAKVTADEGRAYIVTTKGKLFVAAPNELRVAEIVMGNQQ